MAHGVGNLLRGERADLMGWNAHPERTWIHDGTWGNQGPSGHKGARPHLGIVEQGGIHADERPLAHRGPMHRGIVPDGHVVAQNYRGALVERMEHSVVLHVDPIAQADRIHIPPQHRTVPDAAVVA